ncbi:MAG TPA: hypothetical protein DHW61_18880 [Lachnoclostridium phytofermentans]|uniref:Methyltransferase domain-containing protein n=1 Tax=Lachnoclostridium phytofermentans TaxID=66219 RepID=A0A3D2XBD4_9FIRM|nr:hypothetical protein [Lachnoclostridium phytofermentans]
MEDKKLFKEKPTISKWIADMYEQDATDTNDVEFLLSVIGPKPKRILEIACGSGRILVPLAKAGHVVTGLDFDSYMLSKIDSKTEGLSNIFWYKADVINDDWGNDYNIVVIAGNFLFNIISDMDYEKAQKLLIDKSAKSLVSGGIIYIDYGYTLHPEYWFDDPSERVIWEGTDSDGNTGKMILFGSTFDKETETVKSIRRFELHCISGEIIKQDIDVVKHFATLEQIHSWLSSTGFIIEEEYGDYNCNPISETTSRAIIKARKI